MESKKAQNLSITTIILIILGVVVLVVLIIGFTQGWGSVKGFFTGGDSDFQQVSTQCSIACATGDEVSWCTNRTVDEVSGKCTWFASSYSGIEECDITCPKDTTALNCLDIEGAKDLCTEQEDCPTGESIQETFVESVNQKVCCKVDCVNK